MRVTRFFIIAGLFLLLLHSSGLCIERALQRFKVNDTSGLLCESGFVIDKEESYDGSGSLRFSVQDAQVFPLYKISKIAMIYKTLVYKAYLKCKDVDGRAYLQMECQYLGRDPVIVRGLSSGLRLTTDWTQAEITFSTEEFGVPYNVIFSLGFTGMGTAWIDKISLYERDENKYER